MSSVEWNRPPFSDSDLEFKVGDSFLADFARGHTASDVLRELCQNEYDARGPALAVRFREDALEIEGTGQVVDREGWRRLSVMLGTGRVAGLEDAVTEKVNGIGSKNHGLRSLFLIGDEIFVRSGGRQTLLDRRRGAPREAVSDPTTAGRPGVHIVVPYRSVANGGLEPYDKRRERHDFDVLKAQLAPTLLKLADPAARRSLREVTVSSVRCARTLEWRQTVQQVRTHRLRGPVLLRTITVRDNQDGATSSRRISELEYQTSRPLPEGFATRRYPDYFRVRGGRVRIGVSLHLTRRRPDPEQPGSFFYPLGCPNGRTGCGVGVSAPFEMNPDRAALVDPSTSSWNEWLLETAAEFTLELLVAEWFDEFGAGAYRAIAPSQSSPVAEFGQFLEQGLSSEECWPTRSRLRRPSRPSFVVADKLMIGRSAELDDLVPDKRRLHPELNEPKIIEHAVGAGATPFTVSSAVRFRCAGSDTSHLATKLGEDEAKLRYSQFPDALLRPGVQESFARAFEAHRMNLTPAHKEDLATSPTTLTASGELRAPSLPLWVVDEQVAKVVPTGPGQQLHPQLSSFKAIVSLCRPFDVSDWAIEVAARATDGTIEEAERVAVYQEMLRSPEKFRRTAWPTLRRAPIVRDHRGDWVSPSEILQRRAAGARRLEPVLHFPSRALAGNPRLLRALRFRSKITGTDIVNYARIVADDPTRADAFEDTLYELRRFLRPGTTKQLGSIAILRVADGRILPPEEAYVRTPHLVACLGEHPAFAAGRHTSIHEKLGARTEPDASDIVDYLERLRTNSARGPTGAATLYPALVAASKREHNDAAHYQDEPILFDGSNWVAPDECLIGSKHRTVFLDSVPVLTAASLGPTYAALGAHREPTPHHWFGLFDWLDQRSDSGTQALATSECAALRSAYAILLSPPAGFASGARMLLDDTGRLHSISETRASRFLINDDPLGADKARKQLGDAVSFGDPDPSARDFFQAAGVKPLSEARRLLRTHVGKERLKPHWFDASAMLDRLHGDTFGSAVHALAKSARSATVVSRGDLRDQLKAITRIAFVETLEHVYKIGTLPPFLIPADAALEPHRIVLTRVQSRSDLYGALSRLIATLADTTTAAQQPLSDGIYRLLSCQTDSEIERYLVQRGIAWTRKKDRAEAEEDLETDGDEQSQEQVEAALEEGLLAGAFRRPPSKTRPDDQREDQPETPDEPRRNDPLPPLDDVQSREVDAADWTPPERQSGSGGSPGPWRPRTPAEQEEDRELGRRGEELVYREEVARVTAMGFAEERVVWSSQTDAASDHDILSVAHDGGELWLEVKATSGRHGRFDWPRSEFALAIAKRDRYVLCRVYEAHTHQPSILREPDPIAKILNGEVRLDVGTLAAEVAPLSATDHGTG